MPFNISQAPQEVRDLIAAVKEETKHDIQIHDGENITEVTFPNSGFDTTRWKLLECLTAAIDDKKVPIVNNGSPDKKGWTLKVSTHNGIQSAFLRFEE